MCIVVKAIPMYRVQHDYKANGVFLYRVLHNLSQTNSVYICIGNI